MTLAPSWQCMAKGTDGVFRNRDAVGSVVCIRKLQHQRRPAQPGRRADRTEGQTRPAYPGGGDLLAIDSVSPTDAITLRRPYKDLNVGMPPDRRPA